MSDAASLEQEGWEAQQRQDWPEAHSRWVTLRTRFPDALIGYAGDAVALRCVGRFEEAEQLYQTILARWPDIDNVDVLGDYAELAHAQGRWTEASHRWRGVRYRFPDNLRGYLRDVANLNASGEPEAAAALLREAEQRFPDDPRVLIELAHGAQRRGSFDVALRFWERLLQTQPTQLEGYVGAAAALYELGRFQAAASVLRPALQLFPEAAAPAEWHARLTAASGDPIGAVAAWVDFRQRFPGHAVGYIGGIEANRAAANLSGASALANEARERFAEDVNIAVAWASIPEQLEDWAEACQRWAVVCTQHADYRDLKLRLFQSLLRAQRWDEAAALANAALAVDHGNLGWRRCAAECATQRGDLETAKRLWRGIQQDFPDSAAGWAGEGDAVRRGGHLAEAMALLTTALERFPHDDDLEQRLAWVESYARDWPRALSRWADLTRRFPHSPGVANGRNFALLNARQDSALAASSGGPPPFEIPAVLDPANADAVGAHTYARVTMREILLQFESLGDTCEFAMVQRQFGADPLGLLRFATTRPNDLIAALDDQLGGIGDPEYTVVEASGGEFVTSDRRYRMVTSTFVPATAELLESFATRQRRRIQYLRRKLLEDLTAGKKIFLYKFSEGLSAQEIKALYTAIRRYQPHAALLCVVKSGAHPPGHVEVFDAGLFVGFLDRFSTVDINVEGWVSICRTVHARRAALS